MSRNHAHGQRPSTPPFKAAQPATDVAAALEAFDADEDDIAQLPAPEGEDVWNTDMTTAPQDGTLVALRVSLADNTYCLARWGRWRVVEMARWRQREGWKDGTTRTPLPSDFAPIGWARHDFFKGVVKADET